MYWHIPAIKFGKKVMRNYNTLIGRYEGADGMKTGFICASGFNLVASATRNGKRLIAVVLGSPSSPYRAAKAAGLLERGFNRGAAVLADAVARLGGNAAAGQRRAARSARRDVRPASQAPGRRRGRRRHQQCRYAARASCCPTCRRATARPPRCSSDPQPIGKPIVVSMPARRKKPAETQFAAARSKLAKSRQGREGRGAPASQTDVPAAAPVQRRPRRQRNAACGHRPARFAPPSDRFEPARHRACRRDRRPPAVLDELCAGRRAPKPPPHDRDAWRHAPPPQPAAVPMPRPRPKRRDRQAQKP